MSSKNIFVATCQQAPVDFIVHTEAFSTCNTIDAIYSLTSAIAQSSDKYGAEICDHDDRQATRIATPPFSIRYLDRNTFARCRYQSTKTHG
ncbi:hypothetical protein WG66_015096 [Moniliophthora roreri]|nr:hypothetical protein WG66_015096 [Moniliophthora roreri]